MIGRFRDGFLLIVIVAAAPYLASGYADDQDLPGHVAASAAEPLAARFSLENAARSLDTSALAWLKVNQCSQCHANFMCLIARPAIALAPAAQVRQAYESLVADRWEKHGLRYPSEAMVVAVPLAFNDAQTTGKLHPLTRRALDRMLTHQRADGGWNGIGGAERTFMNEYEETLLGALGIAVAPDDYARTAQAAAALDRVRGYVKSHPAVAPYQKGLLMWTSRHVSGLLTESERQTAAESLLALQHADGGWNLRRLLPDNESWPSGSFATELPSDGYGTGFVIFAARQAGVPANDPRIGRGVAWLKLNQRASGRWFTPSLNTYTKLNLPSNSGTAFAVMALRECGEIPAE
jgi:squalene-hopene/tetraprenyl-beta-curcumene cyclase